MKILILSRNKNLYSTRRIFDAGTKRGHQVRVVDYLRCYMNITSRKPTVYYGGESLGKADAVLPRIGASQTFYGTAVVRQFETMGCYCLNSSEAITASRDKLKSLQILAQAGINMPVTGYASHTMDIEGVIEKVGSVPLVMKLLQGTQGQGIVLAETRKAAESVMSAFRQLEADILVQEFIKESSGTDIRALVVGNRVVAAMRRIAPDGEFRSNVHRGGKAEHVKLNPEEEKMAVVAAQVLGLRVAGVDLMRSNRGPLVLEVNSSPGLQGIEASSGVDVAGEIIRFIENDYL
ncbi:MAG TPA: 30S ribosomal protein S6--L-glutamate ligase [Candidatus Marinimicrobia bacterium]|nr:30S ribosomal protein S6--L-glutamate ligase [Candidatus Neomarinimicrobiota bacterium]HIB32705.1 30S ribosomal protein S6--L-glutamate ligase [Candidatus Neomarinimicrobiota bacterium]